MVATSFRITKELLAEVDQLVIDGNFVSRSEAIRQAIKNLLIFERISEASFEHYEKMWLLSILPS